LFDDSLVTNSAMQHSLSHNMPRARSLQDQLWPFDLESRRRVRCDVGYLCANFSLPEPLCSLHRPDVRDRRTSDRRQMRIIVKWPYPRGGTAGA